MDLLLITDENKSHYVYTKDFNRFMDNKTKSNNKKHFRKYCLQCFCSERVLIEHKKGCLVINGKQNVKLRRGSIRFKIRFKQLVALFKIYADFECLLEGFKNNGKNDKASYTKKNIKIVFLAVLLTKFYVLMINLAYQLFFTKEKMQSINLLKHFLKNMAIAKM